MSKVVTPWGPIGYITYKRTYSRRLEESNPNSPTEEFSQTVDRVIKACKTQLNVGFTEAEEKRLEDIFSFAKGLSCRSILVAAWNQNRRQVGPTFSTKLCWDRCGLY